ncbi:hypothetical protein ACJX0J_017010, partial [Zea mays]
DATYQSWPVDAHGGVLQDELRAAPIEGVIKLGVVPRFVQFLTREDLSQLQTKPALPTLARIIHSNDEKVLTDACWALSYLSDDTNDKIQAVIEAGVCPWLVELL